MPAGAARNALDCALLDLEAKSSGQRAWTLLGRPAPRPCTTAYTISLGSPEAMAAATARAAHRPLLKIKLGGDGDGERIAAVRKAAPESELIVDANEAWTPDNLRRNLAACAEFGVTLVEQPLPAGKDEALAHIRRPLAGLCRRERARPRFAAGAARALRRRQHQARQDRRTDRGAGDGRRGAGAGIRDHGRLHGRDLARDGAGDAARRSRPASSISMVRCCSPATARLVCITTAAWSTHRTPRSGDDPPAAVAPATSRPRRMPPSPPSRNRRPGRSGRTPRRTGSTQCRR